MNQSALRPEDRQAAAEAIGRMGEEDLRFLNRLIIERIKSLAQAKSTVLLAQFRRGDVVEFSPPGGQLVVAAIMRINKKSATVLAEDGRTWKVHPSLLKLHTIDAKSLSIQGPKQK